MEWSAYCLALKRQREHTNHECHNLMPEDLGVDICYHNSYSTSSGSSDPITRNDLSAPADVSELDSKHSTP